MYALRRASGKVTQDPGDARGRNPAELLQPTGALFDAPRYQMEGDALVFGANVAWATTHQFCDPSRNIPARPYLYLDGQDQAEAARIMIRWVAGNEATMQAIEGPLIALKAGFGTSVRCRNCR